MGMNHNKQYAFLMTMKIHGINGTFDSEQQTMYIQLVYFKPVTFSAEL